MRKKRLASMCLAAAMLSCCVFSAHAEVESNPNDRIAAGEFHTVWLGEDNLVNAIGGGGYRGVDQWSDIVKIAAWDVTIGVKEDGTVVIAGDSSRTYRDASDWTDIVDAVAGYELYGGPVIVVDFGTATTYDLVTEDGRFVGGVTSPGIRTSANALWQQAAKLPEIEIRKPQYILAKDTVTSMQGGLVYGYIGQTEYIIRKMKEESGLGKINVVATGGLGKMIAQETSFINYYDANLTLKGLQIIYDKQKQG